MDAQALVGIVAVGDQAVIDHENRGGTAAGFLFDAVQLVADGEGQPRAGIGVGHDAPGVIRAGERLFNDGGALLRAGGQIGVDAVAVGDVGIQQRVKARLDRGAQRVQALDGQRVFLRPGGAGLLDVLEIGGIALQIEAAQRRVIEHGVGPVFADVLQAVARGLDGHQAAGQLDGGVAAAALHIIGARADALGDAGEIGQRLGVGFKEIAHDVVLQIPVVDWLRVL